MKGIIKSMLLVAGLLVAMPLHAQMVSNNNEDGVNKLTREAQMHPYRDGEVIVKFKSESAVKVQKVKGKFATSAVSAVDNVMNALGVSQVEDLMPLTGAIKSAKPRRAKAPNGRVIEEPDLSKLYCLTFDTAKVKSVYEAVEMLNAMDEVEYAEPNYLAFIQVATESTEDLLNYINEPLYNQQWALNAIKMPQVWAMSNATEQRPVIAILDTGVDINHPDLQANIWTNEKEADGYEFQDDDANGYYDDVHGWDFIHNTAIINDGMDGNGHGTHCAGIAAAVGDNGLGITGANPNAIILPIKVLDNDGSGNVATIVKGIDYAVACGANIINMSMGGTKSSAEYQAISKAYSAYIATVAAAGNNGMSIYTDGGIIYPAAYDIVLGVMASGQDNQLASYSNYDPDGPFYTKYANTDATYSGNVGLGKFGEFWNYDLMAPGTQIMSTLPNGKYGRLSGTSMSTPLVAGALSRMMQIKGFDYTKDYGLFGDMAEAKITGTDVFDAKAAISYDESTREVAIRLLAITVDDKETGDGDGNADAGETIAIYPTIRSLWGEAKNVKVSIKVDPNVSKNAYTIVEDGLDFGWTLNSRGSATAKNPIKIKINEDVNDGYTIPLTLDFTCDNMVGEKMHTEQRLYIDVVNAVELGGIITQDLTLYPNIHYIVTKSISIPKDVTLTIKPGTTLLFKKNTGISSIGKLNIIGTRDSLITFIAEESSNIYNDYRTAPITFKFSDPVYYTQFENLLLNQNLTYSTSTFYNCIFKNNLNFEDFNKNISFYQCNYYYNLRYASGSNHNFEYINSNIIGNYYNNTLPEYYAAWHNQYSKCNNSNIYGQIIAYGISKDPVIYTTNTPSYFGSAIESIVRKNVYDIQNGTNFGFFDFSNMLLRPSKEAHGIVWKVVVDGKDAQDEFEEMEPLGVGRHKFEVFFNRDDMDTTYVPTITMGLQEPFTQTVIDKDGSWSIQDSVSVYTAYLDIDGKMNIDGLNRISVTGAKDYDHFDVPTENYRFNVMVQKAGSLNTGMLAEAGLGKVNLSWITTETDIEDLMGYNLYRYTKENKSDVKKINSTLLAPTDDNYTDTDVVPGTTYYYYITEMSTDMSQSAISNVVAATPLTAQKGDANGSMTVDVADVVTEVNYITNQPTGTFIFEAADVNSDNKVNIFDVVGTVNIIANPNAANEVGVESTATYTVEDGILYVNTPVALGGLQVIVDADANTEITPLEALDGMEKVSAQMSDSQRLFLSYSMSGKTIAAGNNAILKIGDCNISDISLSDTRGNNVFAINGNTTTGVGSIVAVQFKDPYPNPFESMLTVPYIIGKAGCRAAKFVMTDMAGRVVGNYKADASYGEHTAVISGDHYASGLYFLSLYVDNMLMQTSRVIKK